MIRAHHIAVLASWLFGGGPVKAAPNNPFRVDSTNTAVAEGETGTVDVTIRVPSQHHLYRDMMSVKADALWVKGGASGGEWVPIGPKAPCQLALSEPSFPPGFIKPDPADPSSTREQYDMDVVIRVPFEAASCAAGTYRIDFEVEYQGCKKSLCWMPQVDRVESFVRVRSATRERPSGLRGAAEAPSSVSPGPEDSP